MRILKIVAGTVVVLVLVVLVAAYLVLSGSLPKLDGGVDAPGLAGPVSISRDALGIPTITAANRVDLAYGTGFAHAQDRFFQMDLSRRLAAGELSEVFGKMALEQDEKARLFSFRKHAQAVIAQSSPEQRAMVEAYARGVNAGLASLSSRPWEYWVLQVKPAPWLPEDTALVSYAMWWDLQYNSLQREIVRLTVNSRLGGADCASGWKCALAFFYPHATSWDSPNSPTALAPFGAIRIPAENELNVRAKSDASSSTGHSPDAPAVVGSNGWAVSGNLTKSGAALVASDMHLNLRVPTVWYRARLKISGKADAAGALSSGAGAGAGAGVGVGVGVGQGEVAGAVAGASENAGEGAGTGAGENASVKAGAPARGMSLDLNGLTLAGAPVLVAGSNGHIAWGYTNSYGDWSDVTLAPCESAAQSVAETIHVKGDSDVSFAVKSGPAGVLLQAAAKQSGCWFARWLATVPAATNFNIVALETARTTADALALAPTIGIPHQNLNIGDSQGHIAWSILGRIPDAVGDARTSGDAPWTTATSHPRLMDPPSGRIWTANARAIDDATYEALIGGDEAPLGSQYDLGARAGQIHEDLMAISSGATPEDMLRVQTDDGARFLTRWHDLLLSLLDDAAVQGHADRAELKRVLVEWRARASTDSVGYRVVRAFHQLTERAVWEMLLHALDIDPAEAWVPAQFEGALWEMVNKQPVHLLAASYPDWHAFLLGQVDATLTELKKSCPQLDHCTWGQRSIVKVRHPLSRSLSFASAFLDMPTVELPGDHDMPRVQDGSFGASERFGVSPGHEAEGYLTIAGGQSGHPLSPYYRAGFKEWAEGKPLPFLPGVAEHELTLEPSSR
ncbi:MAG: penicillin acylase family protein [Gammaproteobacteria bacterium]